MLAAAALSAAACSRTAAPRAVDEAMHLEWATADNAGNPDAPFAPIETLDWLVKSGNAGRLRVVRDGHEVVYWAFVVDRAYTPANGNGARGPSDRRSALLVAWRADDARDHFILRGGAERGEFVRPPSLADDEEVPRTRPWMSTGEWVASRGSGDVHFDGGSQSCESLVSRSMKDAPATTRDDDRVGAAGEPVPTINCARGRYTVDAAALMRIPVTVRDTAATYGARPRMWRQGERSLQIPTQTVPGARFVIDCDETPASEQLGCGMPVPQTQGR